MHSTPLPHPPTRAADDHVDLCDTTLRRAAAAAERYSLSPEDAAGLMEILGIPADVFRLRWERTVRLDAAGEITLTLDIDVRALTPQDHAFLRELGRIVAQFVAGGDASRRGPDHTLKRSGRKSRPAELTSQEVA